ncbi:unnamed protein product [Porites evermanni]|uniref:Tyrosine-protein kinase ephrin type A/B receptor-like domain-containing protein n=1 Tax=Porites evermanni TaxID=104178 RepID=A0ABN8T3D1_9CNID|nr:unnamed protein product [Porites evermanni]
MARTIANVIKKAVENGSLSLNVHGTVFVPDKKSVHISEPERLCDTGQVYQEELCVSCTSGTYLNKVLGICEDCPIGTYQEYESQESCLPCPQKTSTVESRTDHRSSCLAFCKAGSYSPTGLEPCISCEKGFYQEKEGQKGCFKCISATTTPGIGSTAPKECRGR